jgi:AcrR family transcriptional regulator
MGRRSDHNRDELTALAVSAAADIIAEEGLAACSARRVAQRIGYTVGTLYHLFENFDLLTLHASLRTLEALEEALQTARGPAGEAAVRALADAYLRFTHAHPKAWAALFEHRLPEGTALPPVYAQAIERLFGHVEAALPASLDAKTRRQSARVLWAGIQGICALAASGKLGSVGAQDPETLIHDFLTRYLKGLGPL